METVAPTECPEAITAFTDQTVARLGRTPEALVPILQALQEHFGYLPEEALRRVSQTTDITPAAITGVSTFYDIFRHQPVGKFIVRVCHGTACHVTGAERVEDALRRRLRIPAGDDTDPDRQFTIEPVACLGCCTLAPVMKIEQATLGHVTAERVPELLRQFLLAQTEAPAQGRWAEAAPQPNRRTDAGARPTGAPVQLRVGLGSCCMAKGSDRIFHALQAQARACGGDVLIKRVGCVGMCHRTPLVEVLTPGRPSQYYADLTPGQVPELVRGHLRPRGFWRRAARGWARMLDALWLDDAPRPERRVSLTLRDPGVKAFLSRQVRLATEHFGQLDPLDLDEYLAHEGFVALRRCLGLPPPADAPGANPATEVSTPGPRLRAGVQASSAEAASALSPEALIDLIEQSGLRGRGGAGFPTGAKWRLARRQPGEVKYVICNGDEGDPGAFMDRMILESFPFRVIEGLAIAAVAVGAHEAFFYIRHEYPLAVARVRAAIQALEERGWLGPRLLGAAYPLRVAIREGAGAFVCGEETALIASIEGRRGMPRLRPPFPIQAGLWGRPTVINNVETLALVPWIVRHGAAAFAAYGTRTSKGTKVFALAGQVRRGGLIEVPMGTTIRQIVEEIGGGAPEGRRFKAVQIGGPSGGCVPARLADTPVDYDSLREVGAIMGSGGLVVLDDSACMVDIARYFLQFTQDQSCGRCTFCRIGTKRMLEILDRLCTGKAHPHDLHELETLARQVAAGSLCGLGKTAPNPVLTTLRYFREEYEAHLQGRCPARKCQALIRYQITADCTGCTLCAQHCPVDAIPLTPYERHAINQALCTKCDTCRRVCPHHAVEVT
jgi:NADH-quinone oxidoreductase subunit F